MNEISPGWYPDETGNQRYWDGNAWTEHVTASPQPGYQPMPQQPQQYQGQLAVAATSDEMTMGALAHGLAIFAGFLGPLIILLVKGDQSVFVKDQAIEALNFSITVAIAGFVAALSILILIGIVLLPAVIIGAFVLHILAAIAASRGEWYRYPVCLRLISGPAV